MPQEGNPCDQQAPFIEFVPLDGSIFHYDEKEKEDEELDRNENGEKEKMTDTTGADPLFTTGMKVIDTAIILAVFFASGVNCALIGLTLVDLERQVSANTEGMSALFMCRGAGILCSCLFAGHLFDRLNHDMLLATGTAVIGLGHLAMPFATNIYTAATIYILQAIGVGALNVGVTFGIVKHWGKRAGPFLHSMLFAYDIAAFIFPLIQKLFISPVHHPIPGGTHSSNGDYKNISIEPINISIEPIYVGIDGHHKNNTFKTVHGYSDEGYRHIDPCISSLRNHTNCTITLTETTSQTDLLGFNLVAGGFILLVAFLCSLMALSFRTVSNVWAVQSVPKRYNQSDFTSSARLRQNTSSFKCDVGALKCTSGCDWRNQVRVGLFTSLLTFVYSIEGTLMVLLVVYLVKGLDWGLQAAMTVASVRALTCAVSRFLMIFISRVLIARYQVIINSSLCTVSVVAMTACVFQSPDSIWVLLLITSLALATLYASSLTWASNQVKITGIVSAIFTTPFATGMLVGPTVASYFFERHGPHWFIYLICLYTVVVDALVMMVIAFKYAFPPLDEDLCGENVTQVMSNGSTWALNTPTEKC